MLIPRQEIIGFITDSVGRDDAWREVNYSKNTILFNDGETIETLFFIKQGTVRLFKLDRATGIEHTVGFIFAGDAYVPLSALSNWCPALSGMQVIGGHNTMIEINMREWQKLMGRDDKQIAEMRNYAISLAIYWIEEFISHFVFDQSRSGGFRDHYAKLKAQDDPLVSGHIDSAHLASYFQLNKKFIDKIRREYVKE